MGKRVLILILLLLTGCRAQEPTPEQIYEKIRPGDVAMLQLSKPQMEALCGIKAEDVRLAQIYVCADSLRADEIWLLQAADGQALQRIRRAAENRLSQKEAESITYDEEQYAVVKQAKIVEIGNFFAMFVSPDAAEMEKRMTK